MQASSQPRLAVSYARCAVQMGDQNRDLPSRKLICKSCTQCCNVHHDNRVVFERVTASVCTRIRELLKLK